MLALGGPLVLLLLDSGVAVLRGWQFSTRLDRLAFVLIAASFTVLVLVGIVPRTRRWLARYAPQICLASVATIVSLAVAEIVSGIVLPLVESPIHLRKPGSKTVYHPIPGVMRGIAGPSETVINSWGVRGSEPSTADKLQRILCLGASSTNCTYLDQTEAWPAVLEQYLREDASMSGAWVGNVGIPSLTTNEHLRFLAESKVAGDASCLILQTGINDFMQAMAVPGPSSPLWTRSRFWRLVCTVARQYLNSPDVVVEDKAGSSYVRRREQRQSASKLTTLPDLKQPLAEYSSRLRAIIAKSRALGLRTIVTSQPVLWTSDPTPEDEKLFWFGRVHEDEFLATPQLRAGMDRYNAATRLVCEELGVEFIDLSDLNGRADVFYDDCHYTEAGARQVARRVADYLLSHPATAHSPIAP